MTQKYIWQVFGALVLAVVVNAAWADDPPTPSCPRCTGKDKACPQEGCPTGAACPACPQCPATPATSHTYSKTFTIDIDCPNGCPAATGTPGIALVPVGSLPVPVLYFHMTTAAPAPVCCPRPCPPCIPAAAMACPVAEKPAGKNYFVVARLVDTSKNNPGNGPTYQLVTSPGEPAQIRLEIPADQVGGCAKSCPTCSRCAMTVKVTPAQKDLVNLDLDCCQTCTPAAAKPDKMSFQYRKVFRMATLVKLGKTETFALDHLGKAGQHAQVLQITVRDSAPEAKPMACPMPMPVPMAPPAYVAQVPDGVVAVPPPPPAPPIEGMMAIPTGRYVSHPIPVAMTPPPAPPADMAYAPVPVPTVAYVPPAPPMAPPSGIHIASDGGTECLEVCNGSARMTFTSMELQVPGGGALKITCDRHQVAVSGDDLTAVADEVTTDSQGQLVLQGHVQLSYCHGHQAPHVVAADKACLRLSDGHLSFEIQVK